MTIMKKEKYFYFTLGFLVLCALALAIVPALMIWRWEMMSLNDPTVVIGLIVSWAIAVAVLIGCGWYHHQFRTRLNAGNPVPACKPATEH